MSGIVFWNILFWLSLLLASLADYKTQEVYDFCYAPAFASGVILLVVHGAWQGVPDLMIYAVYLFVVLKRFVGGADVIALWVCGLHLTATGGGLWDYLYCMGGAYVFCLMVQLFKKNIKNWKFKNTVAFVPYIVVTHFLYTLIHIVKM